MKNKRSKTLWYICLLFSFFSPMVAMAEDTETKLNSYQFRGQGNLVVQSNGSDDNPSALGQGAAGADLYWDHLRLNIDISTTALRKIEGPPRSSEFGSFVLQGGNGDVAGSCKANFVDSSNNLFYGVLLNAEFATSEWTIVDTVINENGEEVETENKIDNMSIFRLDITGNIIYEIDRLKVGAEIGGGYRSIDADRLDLIEKALGTTQTRFIGFKAGGSLTYTDITLRLNFYNFIANLNKSMQTSQQKRVNGLGRRQILLSVEVPAEIYGRNLKKEREDKENNPWIVGDDY